MRSITHTPVKRGNRWTIEVKMIHEDGKEEVIHEGNFASRSKALEYADDSIQRGVRNGGCVHQSVRLI